MDDAELVRSAAEGNNEAFGSIYQRYAGRIYDFLVSIMRDREEAADVLHETFMLAGARIGQLRDPSKLRSWLYAIARHEALRSLSRRGKHEALEEEQQVSSAEPEPPEVAAQGELAELVWAAAGGLNPRDRVVLDLHLRQGLEGQELADALGLPPSHAYVLLNRLKDQVERSLGALLVTRLGRKDCAQLQSILERWNGRFTAQIRKRVVRHVDGCTRCSEVRRRAVSPASLLSSIPLFPLPDKVGRRVMEDVRLVGHKGRPWPASRDGFPPPMSAGKRRRQAVWTAAALVLLAGGFFFPAVIPALSQLAGFGQQPPAQESSANAPAGQNIVAPAAASLIVEPVPASAGEGQPASMSPDGPQQGSAPAAGAQQSQRGQIAPGSPDGATWPGPGPLPGPGTDPAGGGGGSSPRGPVGGELPPADTTAPSVGALAVTPRTVWAESCGSTDNPRTLVVEVTATDASGIAQATLQWGGPAPGQTAMRRSGSAYVATLGPFPPNGLRRGASVTVPLTATATDAAGNTASSTGWFVLRCD